MEHETDAVPALTRLILVRRRIMKSFQMANATEEARDTSLPRGLSGIVLSSGFPCSKHSMLKISETGGPFEELGVCSGQRKMESEGQEMTRSQSCPTDMTSSLFVPLN